ncbi:putative disease resistance RPP8-like protein 4 [Cardamine amara subsp. amara]|uniref:Disease resistance RPP8-like protein 4 n=1 Tax=Cardamine amara subsp. amara TaxID=228776 RepID=A0ABD1AL71_CARAN
MAEAVALLIAEGVVSFAVEKLWDLLSKESDRLHGIDDQLEGLKRELRMLQSLLKDAETKKHGNETLRNFIQDVKDIVYDAEDIIESFLLKQFKGKEKGIKKHLRRLSCFITDRRKFALDIEGITKKISEVIGGMQNLGIRQIIDSGGSRSLQERQRKQREIREEYANKSENDLVGMEQSIEELVGQLVENDNIQVVSISGMGGMGKTTLARKVFHHDSVRRRFDGFAWVYVSQQFTQENVWQRILQELQPHDGEILKMDKYALQSKLFQLLKTGRYLVVLDDVWEKEDWNRMKAVFPSERGWKMLLTSRNEGVGLHADPTCFPFRPKTLTPEQSWKLCERNAFPRTDETELRLDEEMEAIGKKMVTYCGGLPLAVKVLGGLLAEKPTFPEWKRVYDNFGAQIPGKSVLHENNLDSVNRILSLSYEDLPLHLKNCFLYLAHFPQDCNIKKDFLFCYWAAEGIITSFYDGTTIRDSGEYYFGELVRRNMVIVEENYSSSRFESFHMHDMMREVCLSKAKEENFLEIIKIPTSTSTFNAQSRSRSRRLAVHISDRLVENNLHHILGHKNNKKVRSLSVWGIEESFWKHSASGLRSLPLLRVLDLGKVQFEGGKLPSSIGELIHLRYLSLYKAGVTHLPSSLRNLKLLLFLNLLVDSKGESVHVPNVLKGMLELRYLYLPPLMDDKTELELGDLVNLEFLYSFSTQHSSVTDLDRMTKLRNLCVSLTGSCTIETLSSSLRKLRNLETLDLTDLFRSGADSVGEFVLDLIHLKEIVLLMRMPRFPDQFRFPPHLAHITLGNCSMEEDPMPVLEKLLYLKSVKLTIAFVGRRMVCSKGGFPQLSALEIYEESELEEWIVEEGSMPSLRTLTISNCKKLKEIPDGLKYITSLKELKIEEMKKEWKEKLVSGGEDYYKVQHIPNVQFINCDDE